MKSVALDTQVPARTLLSPEKLTERAARTINQSDSIQVSVVSFFEIGHKARLGKWSEIAPFVGDLPDLLREQGGSTVGLTAEIALRAATIEWDHLDPFDRMVAATSLTTSIQLVSSDKAFDLLSNLPKRVWYK